MYFFLQEAKGRKLVKAASLRDQAKVCRGREMTADTIFLTGLVDGLGYRVRTRAEGGVDNLLRHIDLTLRLLIETKGN